VRALNVGKGWEFLRLRIVLLSHRSGNSNNNNNNNPICKAPECQKTSVALGVE